MATAAQKKSPATSDKLQSVQTSLITKFASRFSIDPDKLLTTLLNTVFRPDHKGPQISTEHMITLLVVADQYNLNPFTKEIYAFPDKSGGIVPVVGIDGWLRILHQQSTYDGLDYSESENRIKVGSMSVECPEWIEAVIYRKDQSRPTKVREYLRETYRPTGAWNTTPYRMLRHRATIQCIRYAYGFSGISDENDFSMVDMGAAEVVTPTQTASTPLQLNHQNIDPILDQLIERARPQNMWTQAYTWIDSRFSGAEHAYATQKVRDAEIESMPSAMTEFAQSAGASVTPTKAALASEAQEVLDEPALEADAVTADAEHDDLFSDDNPFS